MKTIILGWTTRDPVGAPQLIAGIEADALEQAEIMDAADRHEFPKGIQFIAQYSLGDNALRQAQFISDEVAEYKQARHKKALKLEADDRARVRQENEQAARISAANKALTAAADKRNKALADVAAQKNLLSAALSGGEKEGITKKIGPLQQAAETAVKEFQVVLDLANLVKNPKSDPKDVAAAMELLKSPAAALKRQADAAAAAEKAAAEKAAPPAS